MRVLYKGTRQTNPGAMNILNNLHIDWEDEEEPHFRLMSVNEIQRSIFVVL